MNLMKLNRYETKQSKKMATVIAASLLSINGLSYAADYTIKADSFQQVINLEAVAVPTQATEISIKPEAWGAYKIEKVLPQGSLVNKGDTLIWIDTEDLDEAIVNTKKARILQKLQLEAAQQGLAELERSTPISIESAQRKYDRYQQNYDYYKKTLKPDSIDSAKFSVKRAEDVLAYQLEELKQLQMMYKEDGLTEETEEIILQRAKNSVVLGERNLKEAKRNAKFTLDVDIPRKDVDWEKGFNKEKITLESSKKTLQRNLKMKQEEVAKLVTDDTKKQEYLDNLIADRKLMEITSPVDGVVHYGEFNFGRWQAERASKVLFEGGSIPSNLKVMSIVPVDVQYQFNAFLKESDKNLFSATQPARLKLKKNLWASYAVEAQPAPVYPNLKHQWLVSFSAKDALPKGVVAGTKATISVITASADNVISVPSKAVTAQPDGTFTVMLKMAEGEPKQTAVTVGRQSGDKLEIIGGVEAGQVIITP